MEKYWGWQPSEVKALTWSEINRYRQYAELMNKATRRG
jgi:hypothetical protein